MKLSGSVSMWFGALCAAGLVFTVGCDKRGETYEEICVDHCEYSIEGEGCDADGLIEQCDDICLDYKFFFSEDCLTEYSDLSYCQIDEGVEYVCSENIKGNGIEVPYTSDVKSCSAESDAFSACMATAWGG